MTDVVVSGATVVRKAPAPPPTIEAEMPAPVVGPEQLPDRDGDIRFRRITDPIALSEDGRELREAMRGRQVPFDAHTTTDGYDQKGVVVEWKAAALPEPGDHESPHSQVRR